MHIKASLLIFLLLALVVFFLQSKMLEPHLRYGFADVDWGYLYEYKSLGDHPLFKIVQAWKNVGIYTYQAYYIGILEHFFPIDNFNFINIHIANHFFKFLSAVTLFPLILALTGKRLLAALTTIIYSIAYPTIGPLYTAVVSGHYLAITVMNLFLLYYWFIVKNGKNGIVWFLGGLILFIITLFLSPERMYPLIPALLLGEFFWLWIKKFSKDIFVNSLIRIAIFFGPLLIVLLVMVFVRLSDFGDFGNFRVNTMTIIQKINQGNWQLALNPLISFASLFYPREYWGMIDSNKNALNNFGEYLEFFLGPFFIFIMLVILLSLFVSKKPFRLIISSSITGVIFGVLVFILASNHLSIDKALREYFATMFIKPALFGVFILSLAFSFFNEWILTGQKDSLLFSLFLGPVFAFLFIFLTWIFAGYSDTFTGVHRYLVIPAIGSSLAISTIIILLYEKIKKINALKNFAWIVFLVIIPIIQLNFYVVTRYFDYELNFAGTDGREHARMKGKLLFSLGDFTFEEPSLFYFDEWPDPQNDYFHETIIIAGFDSWIRFKGRSKPIVEARPLNVRNPLYIRNSTICPTLTIKCFIKLKSFVVVQNGERGILYNSVFYKKENFYAFRLKDRDILDIKSEVISEIGLN